MENTTTTSQSRNAAKVAAFAAVIGLTGTAAVKAKQAVARRREGFRARRAEHLTKDE